MINARLIVVFLRFASFDLAHNIVNIKPPLPRRREPNFVQQEPSEIGSPPARGRGTFGLMFSSCLIAVSIAGCTSIATPDNALPKIISVEEWGGTRTVKSIADGAKKHVPVNITLHHGGVAFLRDKDPGQYLRNLQSWSRGTRMWLDIPYHYLIDLDGNIYEGRDVNIPGDTNTEYDPTGHALIVVLGNFDEVEPNMAQLDAVVKMMATLAKRFNIAPSNIAGHKDFAAKTACPGKTLYPYLQNGYFRQRVQQQLGQSGK
jgi:hypothetical protein